MANVKQAEKRNRQNIKRREHNRASRSAVKTSAVKAIDAIRKDAKAASSALSETTSVIAKAAHRGAIPKGRASRKISRLHKARNKALSGAAAN